MFVLIKEVNEDIPLKEGLKLKIGTQMFYCITVNEDIPLKEGLKHI